MKPGETFQLSESWWKSGKPVLLAGKTGLSGALRSFLAADQKFQSKKDFQNFNGVVNALAGVDKARLAAIQKCGNTTLLKDVKAALEKGAAIGQRKAILMHLMRGKLEPAIQKEEEDLKSETVKLESYQKQIASNKNKIETAKKEKNSQETLKSLGKELGRMWTNIGAMHDNGSFQTVKSVASEYSAVLAFFPEDLARMKKLVQQVAANEKIYKEIREAYEENKHLESDD
jgi:hypothetical protein